MGLLKRSSISMPEKIGQGLKYFRIVLLNGFGGIENFLNTVSRHFSQWLSAAAHRHAQNSHKCFYSNRISGPAGNTTVGCFFFSDDGHQPK